MIAKIATGGSEIGRHSAERPSVAPAHAITVVDSSRSPRRSARRTRAGIARIRRGIYPNTNAKHVPDAASDFVRERLAEMEIRQSDFCRLSMFDQGLLSKIQNSMVTSLSLASVLKLAVGLSVPPQRIFNLLGQMDMHDLVIKSYAGGFSEMVIDNLRGEAPEIADRLRVALNQAAGKLSLGTAKPAAAGATIISTKL